jgi:hypothetical protein
MACVLSTHRSAQEQHAILSRKATNAEESIAPNAELFINLCIEFSSKVPASGYALAPFYP